MNEKINIFNKLGGVKKTFQVTQKVYTAFQQCSGDFNPLHNDEEFARSKGFPERVMYGNILNAFVSTLIGECLPVKNVIIHSQDIQYKNPVFMDDRLEAELKVDGVYESVSTVDFKFLFKNDKGKTVAKGHVQIGII